MRKSLKSKKLIIIIIIVIVFLWLSLIAVDFLRLKYIDEYKLREPLFTFSNNTFYDSEDMLWYFDYKSIGYNIKAEGEKGFLVKAPVSKSLYIFNVHIFTCKNTTTISNGAITSDVTFDWF